MTISSSEIFELVPDSESESESSSALIAGWKNRAALAMKESGSKMSDVLGKLHIAM